MQLLLLYLNSGAKITSLSEFTFEYLTTFSIINAAAKTGSIRSGIRDCVLVLHSFRHSMRDRLRAVECPKEIIDQIGGWSSSDVGESYGEGFPLVLLQNWTAEMVNL